jgi:ribonuclease R
VLKGSAESIHPSALQKCLAWFKDQESFPVVSTIMLRSMSKAEYSDIHESHFGLGIENYLHFTSPIRRLSDLATHRILKACLNDSGKAEKYKGYARRASRAATDGELKAVTAERRIENLYKVIYMQDKIGDSFFGTVSSITAFGAFVTLDNTCEGLIPISELPGFFSFDEGNLTLFGKGTVIRVGTPLTVILEEADMVSGKLRFSTSIDSIRCGSEQFEKIYFGKGVTKE